MSSVIVMSLFIRNNFFCASTRLFGMTNLLGMYAKPFRECISVLHSLGQRLGFMSVRPDIGLLFAAVLSTLFIQSRPVLCVHTIITAVSPGV